MPPSFNPHHLNASSDDLAGNNGIGRYILLPGSDGRAKTIANYFDNVQVKSHSRGHHLYIGTIQDQGRVIDVATVATGMGCPSMEIILHELFQLGGKRFLRVGTAGSLQSAVKLGDIINVQASVRDEQTTLDYIPLSVPAIASIEFTSAILTASKNLALSDKLHTGMVHCKSSLYAGEFGVGPKGKLNKAHLELLAQCGVLASEMETAALFIQSQFYNYQLQQQGSGATFQVLAGAILGIISVPDVDFMPSHQEGQIEKNIIELALESVRLVSKPD